LNAKLDSRPSSGSLCRASFFC